MKQMLSFNSFKNINEHVIFDYKKYSDIGNSIRYKFKVDNLKYFVDIWHDSNKHGFGIYEIEFGFDGQKHEGDRSKKDLRHLNSVLNTVCEIIEKEVKEKKIKKIKIESAGDQKDDGYLWDGNMRSKIYNRFLNNKYGSDKIENNGRYITLDMTKIFPYFFSDNSKNKVERIIDELVRISDQDPNRENIMRGVNGADDDTFNISTDFIENKKHGVIYFEINVWKDANEFNLEWEFIDEGENGNEYFDNFDNLLKFLKEFN